MVSSAMHNFWKVSSLLGAIVLLLTIGFWVVSNNGIIPKQNTSEATTSTAEKKSSVISSTLEFEENWSNIIQTSKTTLSSPNSKYRHRVILMPPPKPLDDHCNHQRQ
jgi:hypothetical protein